MPVKELDTDETRTKSWDAFLDAYQLLLTQRNALDKLCKDILNKVNTDNPKFADLEAKYKEIHNG